MIAVAAHATSDSPYVTVTWAESDHWGDAVEMWRAVCSRVGVPPDTDVVDGDMPDLTRRRALTRAVNVIGRMGLSIGTYYSADPDAHHRLYASVSASLATVHPGGEYVTDSDDEAVHITHVIAWAAHTHLTLRAVDPRFCWNLYSTFVDMDAVGEPIPIAQ